MNTGLRSRENVFDFDIALGIFAHARCWLGVKNVSGKGVHAFSEIDVGYDEYEHEIHVRKKCACVQ